MWRNIAVIISTAGFLTAIGAAFWVQDWQYTLPTPRPEGLMQASYGTVVDANLPGVTRGAGQGLFLHFFNPDCPCSRFNVDHIRALTRKHGEQVTFVAVLQGDRPVEKLLASFEGFGLPMQAVIDSTGELGRRYGVYSTPQAVLLDAEDHLFFRGNYNLARYCTVPETQFARIALESLLAGRPHGLVDPAATEAYGCPLPKRGTGRRT